MLRFCGHPCPGGRPHFVRSSFSGATRKRGAGSNVLADSFSPARSLNAPGQRSLRAWGRERVGTLVAASDSRLLPQPIRSLPWPCAMRRPRAAGPLRGPPPRHPWLGCGCHPWHRGHHPGGRPWPPIWVFLSARAGYRSSLYPNRRYVSRANGRGLKSSRRARARDRKPPTVPGGRRTGNVYWLPPGAKITKNGSDPGEAPPRRSPTSLDRMIFFGEKSLRRAVRQYLQHYHAERNHQGLGNRIIEPGEEVGRREGAIQCRERLGGMLRYYYRDAA